MMRGNVSVLCSLLQRANDLALTILRDGFPLCSCFELVSSLCHYNRLLDRNAVGSHHARCLNSN
jgi:hypothetical protein